MRNLLLISFCVLCCYRSVSAQDAFQDDYKMCYTNKARSIVVHAIPGNVPNGVLAALGTTESVVFQPDLKQAFQIIVVQFPPTRFTNNFVDLFLRSSNGARRGCSVDDLSAFVENSNNFKSHPYFTFQHSYLEAKQLDLQDMDYIIVWEELDLDLNTVCRELNIPIRPLDDYLGSLQRRQAQADLAYYVALPPTRKAQNLKKCIEKWYTKDLVFYLQARKAKTDLLIKKLARR